MINFHYIKIRILDLRSTNKVSTSALPLCVLSLDPKVFWTLCTYPNPRMQSAGIICWLELDKISPKPNPVSRRGPLTGRLEYASHKGPFSNSRVSLALPRVSFDAYAGNAVYTTLADVQSKSCLLGVTNIRMWGPLAPSPAVLREDHRVLGLSGP